MFSKSNLISTLVTSLWGFFGGYILWGILMTSYFNDHTGTANALMKDTPEFTHLIIGCILVAFAFSTIFSKWSRGAHSMKQGAEFGLWMAILVGFGNSLIDFATVGMLDIQGTLVNGAVYTLFFVIMGILASIVYSKTSDGQSGSE